MWEIRNYTSSMDEKVNVCRGCSLCRVPNSLKLEISI